MPQTEEEVSRLAIKVYTAVPGFHIQITSHLYEGRQFLRTCWHRKQDDELLTGQLSNLCIDETSKADLVKSLTNGTERLLVPSNYASTSDNAFNDLLSQIATISMIDSDDENDPRIPPPTIHHSNAKVVKACIAPCAVLVDGRGGFCELGLVVKGLEEVSRELHLYNTSKPCPLMLDFSQGFSHAKLIIIKELFPS